MDLALQLDPQDSAPGLADLYWRLLREAEARGDRISQQRLLALLARHDDGRYVDLIEGTGTLELVTDPPGATVRLYTLEQVDGSLEPGSCQDLGQSPVGPVDLAPGSYLLQIQHPQMAMAWRPFGLQRGADIRIDVCLFSPHLVGTDEGFVQIPAGCFTMSGDPEVGEAGSGSGSAFFVDNISMTLGPVTRAQYGRFLDELALSDPGQAIRYAPLPDPAAGGDGSQPVRGIPYCAAVAFCRWLSARTGALHRLPTEAEWEKAALGAGGGLLALASASVPPAGKGGPAGTIGEWTKGVVVDRGRGPRPLIRCGSFGDGSEQELGGGNGEARTGVGFRLVRVLPTGGGEQISPAVVPSLPEEITFGRPKAPRGNPPFSRRLAFP